MRGEHYTLKTLLVTKYCKRCERNTLHRVSGHKCVATRDCSECAVQREREHQQRLADDFRREFNAAKQKELFSA